MNVLLWLVGVVIAFVLGRIMPKGKAPATPDKQKTPRICERQTAHEMQNFMNYDGSVQE